jgi:hypothetical protein
VKVLLDKKVNVEGLDTEWTALIMEAKKMGIPQEMIREFLDQNKVKEHLVEK